MERTPKSSLNEVTYLRVLAVVSLVAWHSYCSYIGWELAESPLDKYYTWAFKVMTPDANMPLFTFLSGYLFCYLMVYRGKYGNFRDFLNNKVRRLLIPYLILGLVINMTQIGRQQPLELLMGTPNHLWYCLMLFYCFIFCWAVEHKLGSKWNYLFAAISLAFIFLVGGMNIRRSPLGLWMPTYYYFYFYLGYAFYNYRDKLLPLLEKCFPLVVMIFIVGIACEMFSMRVIPIVATAYILMMLSVASKIKKSPPRWVQTVSKYSFGIYVFHQWIIWNVTRYPTTSDYMSEHYILFPFLLFLSVFSISFLLTHLSLKTRLGRYLLL